MRKLLTLIALAAFTGGVGYAQDCQFQEVSHDFPKGTNGKTNWVFTSNCNLAEIEPLLSQWGKENGYTPHSSKNTSERLWYQRGTGTLTLPIAVTLEPIQTPPEEGNKFSLSAFLFSNGFNQVANLGIYKQFMPINGGGFKAVALRLAARKQINPLVEALKLTPAN